MALGVEMLLRSMGMDPEEIQKKYSEAARDLKKTFEHFDQRLDVLVERLKTIEQKVDTLSDVPREAKAYVKKTEGTNGRQHR